MKAIFTVFAILSLVSTSAQASGIERYNVTIVNATSHHVITPPLLVTHHRQYQLFTVGSAASDALATLAETGNNQPLFADANNHPAVYQAVASNTFIPYGQSASFEITARKMDRLSLAGMMATTNDGFIALSGVRLPRKQVRYFAYAYDAGSEMNNESCAYVPGPPCTPESGNTRTESGEGFVTIHNGIQGGGDLNPRHLDWRGPVAIVTITRIDN